jgi:hypothetical protein
MDGFSSLAVYAAAVAAPAAMRIGLPSWLAALGIGDVLVLLGIAVALVPIVLVVRGERPSSAGAPPARLRRRERRVLGFGSPISLRWLKAIGRG